MSNAQFRRDAETRGRPSIDPECRMVSIAVRIPKQLVARMPPQGKERKTWLIDAIVAKIDRDERRVNGGIFGEQSIFDAKAEDLI